MSRGGAHFDRAVGLDTFPEALLKALDRYPFGCTEQTTSRALPLLYVNDVAKRIGIGTDVHRLADGVPMNLATKVLAGES